MSENFEFSPVGVEGKKQRQKSSSSSSFEAFQNERREKRGTLGSRSVFLSHSVFLVCLLLDPAFVSFVFVTRYNQQQQSMNLKRLFVSFCCNIL